MNGARSTCRCDASMWLKAEAIGKNWNVCFQTQLQCYSSFLVFQASFETIPTIHIQLKLPFRQWELCPLPGVQAAALGPKNLIQL